MIMKNIPIIAGGKITQDQQINHQTQEVVHQAPTNHQVLATQPVQIIQKVAQNPSYIRSEKHL